MVFVALLSEPPVLPLVIDMAASPVVSEAVGPIKIDSGIAIAQAVIPAGQTSVDISNDQITIDGGEQAGANLFYGFEQFNVPADATADFQANPTVQRVVGRVTGGDSSNIDGLLTVTGAPADLFLINPAGIVFGSDARLDLPATFTATTAHGLSFGDRWFRATGENSIQELSGVPSGLAFAESSGAIVNLADLSVDGGLTLAAGTVVDLGSLRSENGPVQVLSPESGTFALKNGLLRLDLAPANLPAELLGKPVPLAALLTGGTAEQAAAITVDAQGNVSLADRPVAAGDSVISQITGQSALVAAGNHLYLPSSDLSTTESLTLVGERVYATDTEAQPLVLNAGEGLTIQGREGIDVLALYNDQTAITGGDIALVSDRNISLDAHISSQGDVSFTTRDGQSADFISLYDPIISASGNVSFGSYEGPALKVEATGSITANGDITITGPDTTLSLFRNWESVGEVLLETSQFGSGPNPVPAQIVLNSETNTVSQAELETFLGLAPGSLDGLGSGNAVNGVGVSTNFTAQAGDTVSFDWNFVTRELGNFTPDNDFAVVVLSGIPSVIVDTGFPDGSSSGLTSSPENFDNFNFFFSGNEFGSGPESFSTVIPADGTYTLGIGLINEADAFTQSLLLVDNVVPEPVLISDESLLATSRALILRAGEPVLQNSANVPQLNIPTLNTDFVTAGMGTDPPSLTVNGNIVTASNIFSEAGGPIILTAPGAVTVNGDISAVSEERSGDIIIQGGEISTGHLDALNAFTETSSVSLRATTGDIIVNTIAAGSGGVDIEAAGLFQATDTFLASPRITLDPGEDDALIAFLQEADPDGYSQLDLTQQVTFVIPTSIATRPNGEGGRIRIRHGGGGNTVSDADYDIQGTGTVTSTPFFVGPNAEGVTITVDETFGTQRVEGFVPLFAPSEFPTDASGTSGTIAQLTGDGSLATAFLDEPFLPEDPTDPSGPQPPGPQPPGPQPPPTDPDFSTADTDNLEEETEEETVATDGSSDNLLALRGEAEECDADEITQEDGVTRLSGDCLEANEPPGPQSAVPSNLSLDDLSNTLPEAKSVHQQLTEPSGVLAEENLSMDSSDSEPELAFIDSASL
ncbi:MAG: filamentous hemagglutinin N-terminal domain-containing protein [Cyanobacteria bacterium P01_B01_bin.77]